MREVQNLWQFIFTSWRYPNTAKSTSHIEDSYTNQTGDDEEASSSVNEDNWMDQECNKKVGKEDEENKKDETTATKKARVVWTSELHDQFLQAIRQIGIDRAVPKRILEVMNVQGLTRENVASHLQKYRLYVRRYQDPNHPGEARHTSGMSNNSSNHVLAQDPHLSSYNLSSRFPRFSTQRLHAPQQRQWMPFQSGCSGNGSSSNMNPIISQYFSSELSNNNALDQKIYGGTIQMCNQENMRQPWVGSMLSLNEQSFSSYPNYGMQPKSLTISDSFIHGRRQMLGMDHQQSQVTKGHTSNGMIDQNFSTSNFQGIINFQSNSEMGVENMTSCDTWNQVINLDATNNDYPGGIVGAVGPFESVKFNENHIDVEGGGKIPIGEEIDPYDVNISSVDYLTQDGNSSSGFVNVNQFQGIISTSLSLPEQQQKQGEVDNDTWTNYLRNNSLEETFNGDDLETFVFNQQGGEGMMDFEFDINTFEMDDIENNPLA